MNVKQKILIADDSGINRALLMEILGDGYEYLEAENGVRAVELLREHTDIALVLLDIMMPQMDGFDVLKVMRCYSWLDEIPVIMISAAKDTANIERAYDLGVADYMRRPFERVMVLRQVQNVLMLYAKQKRLTRLVTDQVYEKEHNSVLMISILSHVVEFRNSESGLHVLHIRTLTDLLLHQLAGKTDRYQLDESDISLISTASALHDLGKIVIPTEILNKPGRLTAEEYAMIKTHTVKGARRLCGRSCTAGHSFFGRFRRRGLHRHFRTGRRLGSLLLCLFGTGHGHLQLLPCLLTGRFEVGIFPPQSDHLALAGKQPGLVAADLGVGRFQLAGQLLQLVAALCPHRCCGLRRRLLGKALPQSFVLLPELRHGLLHSLLRLPGKAEFCRIRCADVRNTIFNIQFPVPEPSGPQRNVLFQHCIASLRLRARDPPSSRALCHDAFIICQPYFRLFRMASSSS